MHKALAQQKMGEGQAPANLAQRRDRPPIWQGGGKSCDCGHPACSWPMHDRQLELSTGFTPKLRMREF